MTEYEGTLVLRPTLDDERVQASISRYSQVITQRGGEVAEPNIWGKRRLAYEIKGENDGIYVLLTYKAGGDVNSELDRLMRIDDNIVRHLLVVRPLPNPPKPVSVPEGGHAEGGSRSMPTPPSEGSGSLPKPKKAPSTEAEPATEAPGAEGVATASDISAEVPVEAAEPQPLAEAPVQTEEPQPPAEADTQPPEAE